MLVRTPHHERRAVRDKPVEKLVERFLERIFMEPSGFRHFFSTKFVPYGDEGHVLTDEEQYAKHRVRRVVEIDGHRFRVELLTFIDKVHSLVSRGSFFEFVFTTPS